MKTPPTSRRHSLLRTGIRGAFRVTGDKEEISFQFSVFSSKLKTNNWELFTFAFLLAQSPHHGSRPLCI